VTRQRGVLFVVALLAGACATHGSVNEDAIAAKVAALHPGAIVFVDETEREILRRGRPLNAEETRIALAVGVAHPEQVRVLVHEHFIEPRDRAWVALARRLGITTDAEEAGRAAGHGLELKRRFARTRSVLAHELTHVAQYERLGTPALLRDYLEQLLVVGYERSPIEAEARANERVR